MHCCCVACVQDLSYIGWKIEMVGDTCSKADVVIVVGEETRD